MYETGPTLSCIHSFVTLLGSPKLDNRLENVAWSNESLHLDGGIRIWHKHKNVALCQWFKLVASVWRIFSWRTLKYCLIATIYPSTVANHVHPFMITVCPFSDGCFPQDNTPNLWDVEEREMHIIDMKLQICSNCQYGTKSDDQLVGSVPWRTKGSSEGKRSIEASARKV